MQNQNRRDFLRRSLISGVGVGAAALLARWLGPEAETFAAQAKFKLGVGTYTFRGVDTDTELKHYQEFSIHHIELSSPPFFLNNIDKAAIKPFLEKLRLAEVELVSYYAGDLHNEADISKLVEVAKLFGADHISGSAEGEVLLGLDRACQTDGLKFGIHNHWYANRKFAYESPEDVLAALARTSRAIGATLDTGHMIACGYDPSDAFLKLRERVRIIHLKDDDVPGHNVILGQGKANIAKFLKTIIEHGFSGLVAIEYEEGTDPKEEVRACIEFVRAHV